MKPKKPKNPPDTRGSLMSRILRWSRTLEENPKDPGTQKIHKNLLARWKALKEGNPVPEAPKPKRSFAEEFDSFFADQTR